jgi:anti-sigma factor RsiW
MGAPKLSCEEMEALFEPAVDGDLDSKRAAAFAEHLAGCEHCREQHEEALAFAAELSAALPAVEDADARALAASRRAINRIEPIRRAALVRGRRASRFRAIWLLLGWIGAAAAVLQAGAIADLLGSAPLERTVASPVLRDAASLFSVTPLMFAAGLLLLAVVTAVSLRQVFAED